MKEANKRLARLTDRFTPRLKVIAIDDDWDSEEFRQSYAFYLEHGPSATGISWKAYFYLERDAGFYPSEQTYEQHLEDLGQW
ncbi:protein of unknown function [Shewanella benthica]|uniref:Uncharacterized protein n=1 Tax=Shewanella benthica TaxID=43661 RepID=A0A330M6Z1_9GAMM|nr:hypothetical protein [Shewanella benthica]SQH75527.1 protein of unknown function [Shewanella benthica]